MKAAKASFSYADQVDSETRTRGQKAAECGRMNLNAVFRHDDMAFVIETLGQGEVDSTSLFKLMPVSYYSSERDSAPGMRVGWGMGPAAWHTVRRARTRVQGRAELNVEHRLVLRSPWMHSTVSEPGADPGTAAVFCSPWRGSAASMPASSPPVLNSASEKSNAKHATLFGCCYHAFWA